MILKNKKILVTGADGFIGSHLIETLINKGYHVTGFVLYNSFNSWGWLDTFPKKKLNNIEIIAGDIRDPYSVKTAIKDADVVFHLAALISVPFSYASPDTYIETNVGGTLNVLQSCKEASIERVVVTSTSEVYGTAQYTPIDEQHPLQGQSPYSASKIAAEKIAESFHRSFDTPVVIARPFNTYGPRQSARAVVPTIITQLLSGAQSIKIGSLQPRRDLSHVQDTCNGLIALAECDKALGKTVNIGSGREISIKELISFLKDLTGSSAKIICENKRKRPQKSEVDRLLCNNSLIKELTAWKPTISLEDGLFKTVEWFRDKKNLEKYKSDIYNI